MSDKYNEQVEIILPCCCQTVRGPKHYVGNRYCPADYRPAVAAALRKLGFENDELKTEVERLKHG